MNGTSEEDRLKQELVGLFASLNRLRRELADLHHGAEHNFTTMAETMADIVQNTEAASNTILESMEAIDGLVGELRARKDPALDAVCGRITDKINMVFEACSFQDLTGQRINRLAKALTFIEERVNNMIKVWGLEGISKVIEDIKAQKSHEKKGDEILMHGPQSEKAAIKQDEVDKLFSQDDIDKLFG